MSFKHFKTFVQDIRGQKIVVSSWYDECLSQNLQSWISKFSAIIEHTLRTLDKLISMIGRYPADTTPMHNLYLIFVYNPNSPIASVGYKKTDDHPQNKFAEVNITVNFCKTDAEKEGKSAITHELLHPISEAHENQGYLTSECEKQMRQFIVNEEEWNRDFQSISRQYFSLIEHGVNIDFNEFYSKYFYMGEKLRTTFANALADAGLTIIGLRLNAFDFLETEIQFDTDRANKGLGLMREFTSLKAKMRYYGVPEEKYEVLVQFVSYIIAIYTLPVHAITLQYIDLDNYATRTGLSQTQIARLGAMREELDKLINLQKQVRYQYMRSETKKLFEVFLEVYLEAIKQLVHDDVLYRDIATDKDEMKVIFHASKFHKIKEAQSIFLNQYKTLLDALRKNL